MRERKNMSFRLSPASRAFTHLLQGKRDTSKFGSKTRFKIKRQIVRNHKMFKCFDFLKLSPLG